MLSFSKEKKKAENLPMQTDIALQKEQSSCLKCIMDGLQGGQWGLSSTVICVHQGPSPLLW